MTFDSDIAGDTAAHPSTPVQCQHCSDVILLAAAAAYDPQECHDLQNLRSAGYNDLLVL